MDKEFCYYSYYELKQHDLADDVIAAAANNNNNNHHQHHRKQQQQTASPTKLVVVVLLGHHQHQQHHENRRKQIDGEPLGLEDYIIITSCCRCCFCFYCKSCNNLSKNQKFDDAECSLKTTTKKSSNRLILHYYLPSSSSSSTTKTKTIKSFLVWWSFLSLVSKTNPSSAKLKLWMDSYQNNNNINLNNQNQKQEKLIQDNSYCCKKTKRKNKSKFYSEMLEERMNKDEKNSGHQLVSRLNVQPESPSTTTTFLYRFSTLPPLPLGTTTKTVMSFYLMLYYIAVAVGTYLICLIRHNQSSPTLPTLPTPFLSSSSYQLRRKRRKRNLFLIFSSTFSLPLINHYFHFFHYLFLILLLLIQQQKKPSQRYHQQPKGINNNNNIDQHHNKQLHGRTDPNQKRRRRRKKEDEYYLWISKRPVNINETSVQITKKHDQPKEKCIKKPRRNSLKYNDFYNFEYYNQNCKLKNNNLVNIILSVMLFGSCFKALQCLPSAVHGGSYLSADDSTFSTASTISSLISRMKPSTFFNKYFDCRYNYYKDQPDLYDQYNRQPHLPRSHGGNSRFIGFVNTSSSSSSSYGSSITSNSYENNMPIESSTMYSSSLKYCEVSCDGVTMWPKTKSNSVHSIYCHQILESFRTPELTTTRTVFNNADNSAEQAEWPLMSDQGDHSGLVATRRCNWNGEWEAQANYSACGLDSDKLFILTREQLEKIYEIRIQMYKSKYTHNAESNQAFIDCVDNVLSVRSSHLAEPFCERTFDGWTCFEDAPAGKVVYFPCPDFIPGFNPQNQAHKTCTSEGKWKIRLETLRPWTNYTSCVDIPEYEFRNMIIKLHIVGYSISLVALLISLIIFISFKTLSTQTRIRIHKNFFLSFIINNFMWIIWYLVILDETILFENGFFCQALHVVLHYFLVCNYFWMFCEGLYLHTILVVAFVSESKILKWFYLIGWGIPGIFATVYATLRATSPHTKNCWIDESIHSWILKIPVLIAFVLNIFFLINIVRVLVSKMQAVNTAADTHHTRKAVRAILILIPLLGLHFILTPFRPETNSSYAQVYEIFSAIVLSLQGFAVAMLFCYFNGEVLSVIKKRWNQFMLVHGISSGNRRTPSYHGTEVSVSLNLSNYECNENNNNNNNNNNNANESGICNNNNNNTDNNNNKNNRSSGKRNKKHSKRTKSPERQNRRQKQQQTNPNNAANHHQHHNQPKQQQHQSTSQPPNE